jgi:riboflavin kinase/FMN adenylyltransferase
MKVVERLQGCAGLPFPVVTIGNFDGVHLGHQAVLKLVRERVKIHRGTVVVLTFDPHPLRVLAPDVELRFLSDPEEKLALLEEAGVDVVVRLPFTREFAAQTPEEFMVRVLSEGLGARELYVGQNFRFGKGRQGTIHTLIEACPRLGFVVQAISPVLVEGMPVSSTRIRDLVQEGCMAEAAVLLGRPYVLKGRVVRGAHRGGELGFPTANLHPPQGRVMPPDGVYAAQLRVGNRVLAAVTYIGTRPTFGEGARVIETHLLDGAQDLYGRDVAIVFYERLRGDQSFESSDLLARQIADDVERTRAILRGLAGAAARTSFP